MTSVLLKCHAVVVSYSTAEIRSQSDVCPSHTEGAAAQAAEERNHASNDAKCEDLGWTCIPLAVESYGNWARDVFNCLASLLAFGHSSRQPRHLTEIYSHLNMSLARSAAKAIMGRVLV